MRIGVFIHLAVAAVGVSILPGCAQSQSRKIVQVTQPAAVAPAIDPKAELTLDQIAPDTAAAITAAPTTNPTTQPSLDALEYYARGRAALAARESQYTAINLLEKAAALDPDSPAVQYQLAKAYLAAAVPDKALSALERTVALQPESLEAQHDLARLQVRSSPDRALRTLIMATRTRDYASNDGDAASVDYDLARLLQQSGHDRAAIEQYEKLLWRLSRKSLSIRGNPQVAALARRPEPVQAELARLYERRGKLTQAIGMYEKIAESAPDAFDPQARLVRTQLAAGRVDPAKQRAGDMVKRFRASAPSIELLREVYRATSANGEAEALKELRRLHDASPDDRSITLALAELLSAQGRAGEGEALIVSAALKWAAVKGSPDVELLRRLVGISVKRNDSRIAARAIISASAMRPDAIAELAPLWEPLLQPWRDALIRPEDIRQLNVSPVEEPARQYWLARIAADSGRDAVSRAALDRAVDTTPLFTPAWLLKVEQIWIDPRIATAERQTAADSLAKRARDGGDEPLAAMLEAVSAARSLPSPDDLQFFDRANVHSAAERADFQIVYAGALLRANQNQKFEQLMWKLISDHPMLDQAYLLLLGHYSQGTAAGPALKVVNTWLGNHPASIAARLQQSDALLAIRQDAAAEVLLKDLADETGSDPTVLAKLRQLYVQTGQVERAFEDLRKRRLSDRSNGAVVEALVMLHILRGETPAALRELESAATDAAGHANLLYYLANLFHGLGEKPRAEGLMEQALDADPKHVPSSNDLAYFWSDAGQNLPRAEEMARFAVAAEPDNSAYLDTLGWALYKQGRFEEARGFLEKAVQVGSPIDPVLIDHYGDALYRIGNADAAVKNWRQAQDLLGTIRTEREDYTRLRIDLQNKLKQRAEGIPVEVSPVVEARTDGK